MITQPLPRGSEAQAIASALAKQGLHPFRQATGGKNRIAMEMYVIDAEIVSHLHATFRAVEILMREHMHRALAVAYTDRWFDKLEKQGVLDKRSVDKIKAAKEYIAPKGRTPPVGKIVAQLMLGTWVDLLDQGARKQYDTKLWDPVLQDVFRANGGSPSREEVFDLAKRVRWARNRVNHCEPVIFGLPLVGEVDANGRARRRSPALILEDARNLADMIDPTTARWIRSWNAIDELLAHDLVACALDFIGTQRGISLDR